MKKTLLHYLIAFMTVFAATQPAQAGESVVASQVSSMDLNAIPLVSRTLYELDGQSAAVDRIDLSSPEPAIYLYGDQKARFSWLQRPDWILDSLIEPLYLSLLGAGLLILGTFKRRDG